MARNLTRPDEYIPPKLIDLTHSLVTPEQFEQLCAEYRDLRLELTSTGELIVMPPAGSETGRRNFSLTTQLGVWSRQDGTGVGFGSSAGFTLPNGAIRSPDASWISREKWDRLSERQKEAFAPVCPDFVIELRSRTDNLAPLLNKMREYISNGAALGWLIDPQGWRVYVYRPAKEVVILENPKSVSGDPILPGFKLEMAELW